MSDVRTTGSKLRLYLVKPTPEAVAGSERDYDVYCGVVVAAFSETCARTIHPNTYNFWSVDEGWYAWEEDEFGHPLRRRAVTSPYTAEEWVSNPMSDLDVTFLGDAQPDIPAGVVLVNFAAG